MPLRLRLESMPGYLLARTHEGIGLLFSGIRLSESCFKTPELPPRTCVKEHEALGESSVSAEQFQSCLGGQGC